MIVQDRNTIKVRFDKAEKSYILDKKFVARPRFENDDEIISIFTEYSQKQEQFLKDNFSAILTAYPVNILCTGRERRYVKLTKETARDNAALPGVQPATLMQSGDFASPNSAVIDKRL